MTKILLIKALEKNSFKELSKLSIVTIIKNKRKYIFFFKYITDIFYKIIIFISYNL